MTTFYRLKENGFILDYTEFDIATETTTQMVTRYETKEVVEQEKVYDEEGNFVLQDVVKTIEVPYEVEETVTIDYVPAFIREQYIETDRKIIKLTTGAFAFEDEVNLEEEAKRKAEKEFNEAKDAKIAELKQHRDTEEVEPIFYNGNLFDYDEKARDRIKDAQEMLKGTELTIEWTTAINTDVALNYADFKSIRGAVAIRADVLHKKYRGLREQVDKATTIAELEAIVW